MSAATADSRQTGTESSWRRALQLARALPCAVSGPVLLVAFLRLAAIGIPDRVQDFEHVRGVDCLDVQLAEHRQNVIPKRVPPLHTMHGALPAILEFEQIGLGDLLTCSQRPPPSHSKTV
jgi:hypothetical protein